jgi:hypothetical protein
MFLAMLDIFADGGIKGEYLKILEGLDVVFSVAQTLPLASSDEPFSQDFASSSSFPATGASG